jgi:F0F1-type ATP synthase assembly protein I
VVSPGRDKLGNLWTKVAFYSSLGFILPASVVGGLLLGWYLDRCLHTTPVLAVALGFLGAAAGLAEILRLLTREEKRERGNDSGDRSDPS